MTRVRVMTATDLHQSRWMYQALEKAVHEHKPDVLALVGDFLDSGLPHPELFSPEECASHLAALRCEVVFIRGNHEGDNWYPFVNRWLELKKPLHNPHGEPVVFGPLVILVFPSTFAHEEPFLMGRRNNTFEFEKWIPDALKRYGPAARTLWLFHEPPAGTCICDQEGPLAGVDEWRMAIEFYQPFVTISGHDHETPVFDGSWHDVVGQTLCVNVGQPVRLNKAKQILHYCLIDFEFAAAKPALPLQTTVTAFPWTEALVLPDNGNLKFDL